MSLHVNPHLFVELAQTPAEHARGLMYRTALAPDHGMLFVFTRPRTSPFWNKNTFVPLSVGFYDAQDVLIDVFDLFSVLETIGRVSYTPLPRAPYVKVLEAPRGWFAVHGLASGSPLPPLTVVPRLVSL